MFLDSTIELNPLLPKYLKDHCEILDNAYNKGNHALFERTLDRLLHTAGLYHRFHAIGDSDYKVLLKRYGQSLSLGLWEI